MARVYRLSPWRRGVNAIVRVLLRIGAGPPRTYLLSVRGRVSGRPYSTPVTLVEDGAARWLVAPYGEVAWVRNARAAGEATLQRGRRSEVVAVEELAPAEAAPVLRRYVQEVPVTRPFFDARPGADLAAFAAEAGRHPVFRVDTHGSARPGAGRPGGAAAS